MQGSERRMDDDPPERPDEDGGHPWEEPQV
jgi:hypothetical protein